MFEPFPSFVRWKWGECQIKIGTFLFCKINGIPFFFSLGDHDPPFHSCNDRGTKVLQFHYYFIPTVWFRNVVSISYIQLNFFYELNAFTPYPVLKCFYIRTEGAHDPGNSANMVTIIRQRERVNLMVHI